MKSIMQLKKPVWIGLLGVALIVSCQSNTNNGSDGNEQGGKLSEENKIALPIELLNISYKVPGDLPQGATEGDMAIFAWNEFFALNWKASTGANIDRTTPDTSWSLSQGDPEVAVWETYFHRTELAPKTTFGNGKGKPNYSFATSKKVGRVEKNITIDTTTNNVILSDYWNVLDEDNEIGSCYLYAYDAYQVLYMAKANFPEFNYLKSIQSTLSERKSKISKFIGSDPKTIAALKPTAKIGFCESDTLVCLPCGKSVADGGYQEGAIEIKTAWRKLIKAEGDDPSRFMTKKVVVFTGNELNLVADTATFGLIGLHIIHKTYNYPSFIYASFEQVDVRDADMKTIGLDNPEIDPHTLTPVIDREISSTVQAVNTAAKGLITREKPNSVWQYYQLIGVQGKPIDYSNRASDPNYFMANYVIESDSLLTFFHGKIPAPFDENVKNVVQNGVAFNMGGCQGCHGRAQFIGQDFSFIAGNGLGKPFGIDPYQNLLEVDNVTGSAEDLKKFLNKIYGDGQD